MQTDWNKIIKNIVTQFSAHVGMIHRLDPKDNHLYIIAHTNGFPEALLNATHRVLLGKGIAGNTAQSRKPIVLSNLTLDQSEVVRPLARTIGVSGMASVPVFLKDEVVGTLGIGCLNERQFNEKEIDELLTIGKGLAGQLAHLEQ